MPRVSRRGETERTWPDYRGACDPVISDSLAAVLAAVGHAGEVAVSDFTPDFRVQSIAFGGPLFVPGPPFDDEWQIRGVDTDGADRRPVGVVVMGGASRGYPTVRTTEGHEQPLFVEVANLLSSSVVRGDIALPLTITVTERSLEFAVEGERVAFQVLESGIAWRVRASIDGRNLSAAGIGPLPEALSFSTVVDIEALPPARFG